MMEFFNFNGLQMPNISIAGLLSTLVFLAAVIAIAVYAGRILAAFTGLNRKLLAVIVGVAIYAARIIGTNIVARYGVELYVRFINTYDYVVLGVGGLIILIALARRVLRILFGGR